MGLGKGAEAPTSVAVVMIYQQKYNNTLWKKAMVIWIKKHLLRII